MRSRSVGLYSSLIMSAVILASSPSLSVSCWPSDQRTVTLPSAFPKYAAFAIPQNNPTSTTPVSILILTRRLSGSRICASSNGASITKLPLSYMLRDESARLRRMPMPFNAPLRQVRLSLDPCEAEQPCSQVCVPNCRTL